MTHRSWRWCSGLRSRLFKAIGVERILRQRVNRGLYKTLLPLRKLTFFFTPCAAPELLTRLRLLITSVFRLIGRGRPCSFRNRPQALQSTEPTSSRRHRGVVEVPQFPQIGGCDVSLDTIEEAIEARKEMGMLRFVSFCYRQEDAIRLIVREKLG